ncbi:MAG: hypothetical protein LQ342_005201 [Letrouitia transgressa]|nr:MAG: hypothetical protein LQ342_005201 [Letrouitia transgressa]
MIQTGFQARRGSGKTQLALKYAETHYPRKYNTLLWFDANSPQRLSECFLFTAKILGIIAATTATSRSSAYKAVTKRWEADYVVAVKEWLKKRRGRYLLVFDNADTDEMIDLLPRFLPVTGQGHTLITSRRDRVYILGGIVLVEGLPPESAADLLLHHAGIEDPSGEQRALGLKVVSKMGYLALAIDLAGVFIRTLRGDIKKYDQMYAEAKDKVNQMALHESHNAAASSYPYSVFAAWDISRNALSPPAQDFLHLLSFFNRDYLNLDIFGRCCGTRVRWKVDGELQFRSPTDSGVSDWLLAAVTNNNGTFNQYKLLKIVSEICSFSFASTETVAGPRLYQYDQSQLFELGVKSETTTMAMHPLLHEIGRLYLDAEEQERFAEQAECILWHSIDDDANKPWRKSNQEYFPVLHIGGGATQNVPLFISQLDEVFRHLQSVMTLAFPDHDDIISDTGHLKSYYFCLLLLYLTRALNAKTVKEINTTYSIFTKHIWISRLDTELRRLGVLRRQDLTTQWLRLASRQCKLMLKSFSDDLSIPTMENYFYLWNYAVECELETYLKYLKTKAAKKGLTLEGMESEQTPEEAVNIVKKIQGSQLLEQIELGQQNLDYSTMTSAKQ